jgi:hypothetical protein
MTMATQRTTEPIQHRLIQDALLFLTGVALGTLIHFI